MKQIKILLSPNLNPGDKTDYNNTSNSNVLPLTERTNKQSGYAMKIIQK